MSKPATLIPLLLSALLGLSARAAELPALSLGQLLRDIDHTPRVERAASSSNEARWGRIGAYSGFLPTLSLTGNHLLGKKFALIDVAFPGSTTPVSIPQILSTTSASLNAQWTVFDGFANLDRLQSAWAFEHASQNEAEWTRFETEREVILLYYRALAARTLKEVAEQNLKTLGDHLEDARLLKRSGEGTTYEVLRVEVQASEARAELLNAEDNIAISLLRLGEALGRPLEKSTLEGTLPVLGPEDIMRANYDAAARSDLAALRSRVEGYEQSAGSASKFWIPHVSLFGQFTEYNNRTDSWTSAEDFRNAYAYGVQLSWNLFDGLSSIAQSRQASEKRFQAEKTLEITETKARNDYELWRRKYLYNCSVYRSRVSDVAKATESVRLARAGRRAGMRTSTDLLDAELELFRARAGLVNSQLGAIEALVNLELSIGHKLYDFK